MEEETKEKEKATLFVSYVERRLNLKAFWDFLRLAKPIHFQLVIQVLFRFHIRCSNMRLEI